MESSSREQLIWKKKKTRIRRCGKQTETGRSRDLVGRGHILENETAIVTLKIKVLDDIKAKQAVAEKTEIDILENETVPS